MVEVSIFQDHRDAYHRDAPISSATPHGHVCVCVSANGVPIIANQLFCNNDIMYIVFQIIPAIDTQNMVSFLQWENALYYKLSSCVILNESMLKCIEFIHYH